MRQYLILLAGCLFSLPIAADAATITHEKLDATTGVIGIEGDIVSGDLERFRQISLRYPKAVVVLNSDGGLIYPAIEIGKIIKVMGYATAVRDNDVCASACALIWMAGSRRFASYSGNVGFHASYRNESGKPVESGAANALVGNYLTLLGASAKTVVFATTAPPDKVLWLTAANKEASGIDFENFAPTQARAAPPPAPLMFDDVPETPPSPKIVTPPPIITAMPAPVVQATPSAPRPTLARAPAVEDDGYTYLPSGPSPSNWQGSNSPTNPWVLTFTSDAGSKTYINQETFKPYTYHSITGWEFWVKFDASNDRTRLYRKKLRLYQINCKMKKIRSIMDIEYDKNGEVISSFHESDYTLNSLTPVVPDTLGYALYEAVC